MKCDIIIIITYYIARKIPNTIANAKNIPTPIPIPIWPPVDNPLVSGTELTNFSFGSSGLGVILGLILVLRLL